MTVRTIIGDCRAILPTLAANSVQCVVTSPPYYGLRDYGTAQWEGGDSGCDHLQRAGQRQDVGRAQIDGFHGSSLVSQLTDKPYVGECGKCGARRIDAQIGLEGTPEEYLATMVGVFREVRRILRPEGVMFLNIGDSYAHTGAAGGSVFDNGRTDGREWYAADKARGREKRRSMLSDGIKPKDLLMMPARLALALQADGWWLRSDIIWAKPNPMPESVTDRPTSAHEHIFLLTKRSRYFYDADAVREEPTGRTDPIRSFGACPDRQDNGRSFELDGMRGRSCRNVWTIATSPFSDAHFATFPPALVERCIRAGTSERGCCAACGKAWVRQVSKAFASDGKSAARGALRDVNDKRHEFGADHGSWDVTTTGWAAGCACGADTRPCVVLDPFGGAGTTGLVADRLQRDAVMIELNPAYVGMADARIVDDCPLFSSWPPVDDPEDARMADLFAPLAAD